MLNRLFKSINGLLNKRPRPFDKQDSVSSDGERSKDTARKRLQLVLIQDRMAISPDVLDAIRRDVIKAVTKHLRIDRDLVDMQLTHSGKSVVLQGNIRVDSVHGSATG